MKNLKVLLISILLLCGTSFSFSVSAQVAYEGCVDIRGFAVASIPNYNINDVATAVNLPNGKPVIFYNPNVLASLAPQTRMFFYIHECGHQALGHVINYSFPMVKEQEADCFAIRTLVQRGMINNFDKEVIQKDLWERGRGDWSHLPGPKRSINLDLCLKTMPKGDSSPVDDDDPDMTPPGSNSDSVEVIKE